MSGRPKQGHFVLRVLRAIRLASHLLKVTGYFPLLSRLFKWLMSSLINAKFHHTPMTKDELGLQPLIWKWYACGESNLWSILDLFFLVVNLSCLVEKYLWKWQMDPQRISAKFILIHTDNISIYVHTQPQKYWTTATTCWIDNVLQSYWLFSHRHTSPNRF